MEAAEGEVVLLTFWRWTINLIAESTSPTDGGWIGWEWINMEWRAGKLVGGFWRGKALHGTLWQFPPCGFYSPLTIPHSPFTQSDSYLAAPHTLPWDSL